MVVVMQAPPSMLGTICYAITASLDAFDPGGKPKKREAIMNTANDTTKELTIDELYAVAGGTKFVITKLMDVSVSSGGDVGGGGGGAGAAINAWKDLLRNYGYPK